ncbi:cell division protein FtsK [Lactobacillus sp. CBA3605]|uniref:DNA translocase FtsK n=1 Tax=Lactobacillus sp. CBA3605 TaxID=2099788 RepID=UPI000CFC22DA|nr:DNA translocase FtsK [Lactobacillus sp. CBA3605]AVK62368.1 cell division protein FtsK [Lactobacillus sp. CBA3605]
MTHYDGPAFYRKYHQLTTKKQPSPAVVEPTPPVDTPPNSAPAAPASTPAMPATSASSAPATQRTHGIFHPSHVPAQLAPTAHLMGSVMPTDQANYLEIEASLHKAATSYLLFATATDIERADTESSQLEPSQAAAPVTPAAPTVTLTPTSYAATVVFEPEQVAAVSSASVAVASSAPTVVFEPTHPIDLTDRVLPTTADSAVSIPVTTVQSIDQVEQPTTPESAMPSRTVASAVDTAITVTSEVAASQSVATSAVTTVAPTSDVTSAAAKPTHGLGLSLDAIMTEEHNAQADLALFKDEPSKQPAPTTPVAEADLYQPVGVVHPVVASTPVTPTSTPRTTTTPASTSASVEADVTPVSAAHNGTSAAPVLAKQELAAYHLPPLDLLKAPVIPDESEMDDWIEGKASALDESLDAFGVDANVVDWTIGPTVTQFQVKLARGVKVNKITNLNDDLKLALAAKDIRIEAPIPGRNTVGIEIPNKKSRPVMLSEVLNSDKFRDSKSPLTVALGVDLFGQPQVTDLRKMPHGLIAGATGSGKSVFINSILVSLLYKANPQEVKLLLIDPKAVELAPYDKVPHLLAPVISEPKAASAALKWVVDEMDNRYDKLAAGGARNIEQFNEMAVAHHEDGLKMPYIVIVIDELADLMMVASSEVQDYIARITQKARAAGIHLLVATQRPSVDVVTGLIKNNIPTRIAFMVASQIDSRTILDASGAERLLGRGDMLYLGNGQSTPIRLQGTYVDSEIDDIAQFVREQAAPHYEFQPDNLAKHEEVAKSQDDLMPEVLAYLAEEDTVSTSKLQRTFSVGYNRAANIIDDLEQRDYVSAARGSKPRDVYFTADDLTNLQANS